MRGYIRRVRRCLPLLIALALPVLAACQPTGTGTPGASASPTEAGAVRHVPSVAGKRLPDAVTTLIDAGFKKVEPVDASAEHRLIVNPENWVVKSQTPAGGSRADIGTRITLSVAKPSDQAGGSGGTTTGTVPNVVCKDLGTAQDALRAAGFPVITSTDGTGKGRTQIVDSNWVVVAQSAAAGSHPDQGGRIVLTVVKFGEPTGTSGCKS
jgi:beta-lactam-binding protein with PASTA domain